MHVLSFQQGYQQIKVGFSTGGVDKNKKIKPLFEGLKTE